MRLMTSSARRELECCVFLWPAVISSPMGAGTALGASLLDGQRAWDILEGGSTLTLRGGRYEAPRPGRSRDLCRLDLRRHPVHADPYPGDEGVFHARRCSDLQWRLVAPFLCPRISLGFRFGPGGS